jgi:recombination protein RecR
MPEYPSLLLENAVNELSRLPGIGKKTAMRLALFLLRQDRGRTEALSKSLMSLREGIHYCERCHNISDQLRCAICNNPRRDENTLCIVEDMRDVMAIERTSAYNGLYHVLGGVINPIEGIGPGDLTISHLLDRMEQESFNELILALPPTVEGDTTSYYLHRQLNRPNLKLTTIAKGVAIGDTLEFADEVTLGRSITNRVLFDK